MSELLERLVAEASELQFDRFTLDDAWVLGGRLRAAAAAAGHPIAIAIWFGWMHQTPSNPRARDIRQ